MLNEKGVYLTNIIASLDGNNSRFLKAEIQTLKQVFKNVYVVPCNTLDDFDVLQNIMVVATDQELELTHTITLNTDDAIILTDDFCPVESLLES